MKLKTLAIIGSGDLGMQIAHFALSDGHYDEVVFFDDFEQNKIKNGFKIVGNTNDIVNRFKESLFDEILIGIGYKYLSQKKEIYNTLKSNNIPVGKIIHSTCWVDSTAIIEEGNVLYPRCIIDANVHIGVNNLINLGCVFSHDGKIGGHSFYSPSVSIAGFVEIGEMCNLGINSTIIDNIKIVDNVTIGGATTVIKNIDNQGVYVGSPARKVK